MRNLENVAKFPDWGIGRPWQLTKVILVQNLDPCECDCEDCGYFFRSVTVWVVSAITVFAATVVAFHYFHFGRRNEYEEPVQNQYDNLDDILDG